MRQASNLSLEKIWYSTLEVVLLGVIIPRKVEAVGLLNKPKLGTLVDGVMRKSSMCCMRQTMLVLPLQAMLDRAVFVH